MSADRRIGVVAIGRNEGARLIRCLESLVGQIGCVVYVDSGSTDDSVAAAAARGAAAVELDLSKPFTAARARNRGFQCLMQQDPDLEYVQFLDGDCEVMEGWLDAAAAAMDAQPALAAVGGRCRERYRDASVYNRLCDLEWNTPVGEAKACGGNALMRVAAFKQVGGYNDDVIAGEEPELCVRLRQSGWRIERIDADMVLHDAAMTRLGQWWKRNVRAGHAYAEGAAMHGRPPERHCVREARSNYAWGVVLPLAALAAAWPTYGLSLLLVPLGYAALAWRIARGTRQRFGADAGLYGRYGALGKLPQAWGQCRYVALRLLGRRSRVIEYKQAEAKPA